MSFVRELERMQQSIRELSQCFEALKEATDRITPPEYPTELRDLDTTDLADPKPRQSIDEASPQEWDSVSRKFYRNPKGG